jgi:amino acid permease
MTYKRLSNSSAIISTIVSTLGSGITLMPAVFNKFGIPKSILIMCFIGLITYISLYSISFAANSSGKVRTITYEGIANKYSSKLMFCVAWSLILSSLATAFSFVQTLLKLIFQSLVFNQSIAKFINPVVDLEFNKDSAIIPETTAFAFVKFAILTVLAIIYYMLFKLENLSSLDIFSKLSLFCCFLFSCVTFTYGLFVPYDFSKQSTEELNLPKMDFGNAFGSVIFALHCQFSFPDILSEMEDQSLENYNKVTIISSVLATILYSSVGMLGFLGFGPAIGDQPIVVSFGKSDSALAQSLRSRFGNFLGLYLPRAIQTAYLPIFFSGIVFNLFGTIPLLQQVFSFNGKPATRSNISLMLSFFIIASGAYLLKDLGFVFGIIGFLLVIPLSFLFPAIFVIHCSKEPSLMKYTSYFMCGLSLVSMIVLFADTFKLF